MRLFGTRITRKIRLVLFISLPLPVEAALDQNISADVALGQRQVTEFKFNPTGSFGQALETPLPKITVRSDGIWEIEGRNIKKFKMLSIYTNYSKNWFLPALAATEF